MLRVRCMAACRAGLAREAPCSIPISRIRASLSTGSNSVGGGKSTMRKIEPAGGGATPMSRSARSAPPEISAGDSSVTHSSVEVEPLAFLSLTLGAAPSITTTAFPDASWPVTTRLVACATCSRGRMRLIRPRRPASPERRRGPCASGGGQRTKAESGLSLRYRRGVPRRNTPVIVPPGGPFPVFRGSDLVPAADALDFRGVLDGCAERGDKIGENVVAGSMTPRTPEGLDPRVFQPSDAAHDRIDVRHFEGDVIEQRIVRLGVGERVVDAVAAHEVHEPGAVGKPEPEHIDGEACARFPVPGVQDDVRDLQRSVTVGAELFHALSFGDEPEHVALGAFEKISRAGAGLVEVAHRTERRARRGGALAGSPELGLRARESDRGHRGFAGLRNRDDIRYAFGAPEIGSAVARAGVKQAPSLFQKPDRSVAVRHFKFDAAQPHVRTSEPDVLIRQLFLV